MSGLEDEKQQIDGVLKDVYEQFINELEKQNMDPAVIARLRKSLIEEGSASDLAIQNALFPEQ